MTQVQSQKARLTYDGKELELPVLTGSEQESGMDIADSVCPAPMTRLSLAQYRQAFYDKNITIWGGVPSISVLPELMNDCEFERYFDDLLTQIGNGRRLVLSIADTTPPGAKFERIEHIAKLANQFKVS